MRGHVVAVPLEAAAEMPGWTSDDVMSVLCGPGSAAIDKSWEAAFPLIGSIAGGGMLITDEVVPVGDDLGFGPAMYVAPEVAAAISARLGQADAAMVEAHWAGLDSPFMAHGLYDDAEGKEFAMDGYRRTAAVFAAAAAASQGVLFAIV